MTVHYLTGIEALNYHGADWHSFAYDFNRRYPEEVRTWAEDYGIIKEENREVANPVRAFLDYLFYNIRFRKRVPVKRISDLNFSDKEEKEIKQKLRELLEPALKEEELELLKKWERYNRGEHYELARIRLLEREAWKRRTKKAQRNVRDFKEAVRKAFNL
ncbi:hypothetical protein [Desulfurobacterium sp. TC5-1]|uniref:hypothetical protein n=1 Tax=Desulfurobacterium sp. TC5-1 TaxID=1158318 RepID=UPI0003B41ED5|nr:hypothetical protein [Desulfurobacterium sp. TC5-1]